MKNRYECYISIGSNMGDKEATIRKAIKMLAASDKIQLESVSSFYETPPWGKTDQPLFFNGALRVSTELEPMELLRVCQDIEQQLGRDRHIHWGPRTIDLDLLYIDGVEMDTPELTLPHKHMLDRAFVLVPLSEIAPGLRIKGKFIGEYLMRTRDKDDMVLIKRIRQRK